MTRSGYPARLVRSRAHLSSPWSALVLEPATSGIQSVSHCLTLRKPTLNVELGCPTGARASRLPGESGQVLFNMPDAGVPALGTSFALLLLTTACGEAGPGIVAAPQSILREAPSLSDYRAIPLPVTAPPTGAHVHAVNFAHPDASGQHLSFEYQGFTINTCWRDLAVSDPDACLPQIGVSTFRTIRLQRSAGLVSAA